MSAPINPNDLPSGAFLRAVVSFKNDPTKGKGQKDTDIKVKCILIKDADPDKYSVYPYIRTITRDKRYQFRRIECVWHFEHLPASQAWLQSSLE